MLDLDEDFSLLDGPPPPDKAFRTAIVRISASNYVAYYGDLAIGSYPSNAQARCALLGAQHLHKHLQANPNHEFGPPPYETTDRKRSTSPDKTKGLRYQGVRWYITSPKPAPTFGFKTLEEAAAFRQELLNLRPEERIERAKALKVCPHS